MGEFGLSGYNDAAAGERVGEGDGGGIEELLDDITRAGDLVSDGLMGHVHFGETEGGELVERFLDGQVKSGP
ncbi:MAG: hypothetical protein ACREYF_26435, partial [Gammaproteobacteria bacterium]